MSVLRCPAHRPPAQRWSSAAPVPLLLVAVLAGCSSSGSDRAPDTVPASGQLLTSHVHGVGIDPGSGSVLVATHEGLVQVADGAVTPVGPTIDLMAFERESMTASGRHYRLRDAIASILAAEDAAPKSPARDSHRARMDSIDHLETH